MENALKILEKKLCVCNDKHGAHAVKNSIQRSLPVKVVIERTKLNSFSVSVRANSYEKSLSLLINDYYIMFSIKPLMVIHNRPKDVLENDKVYSDMGLGIA